MEFRLLHILIQKYKDLSEVRGKGARQVRVRLPPERRAVWTGIISSAGCELMPFNGFKSDDNDIFINHLALGTVRIPRDIALKILVLGGLP
jgi:hypothetical protein